MNDSSPGANAPPIDLEIIVQGAREGQKSQLRLWLRMLSITKLLSHEIRRRLRAEFDATLPQFDLLSQLYRERDGLRLGELSRRTMSTNGNVTGLVDRLVTDGLIARENLDGDRRVTIVKLTRRGSEMFAGMAKSHENWLRELMGDLDDDTIAQVLEQLGAVKSAIGRRIAQAGD